MGINIAIDGPSGAGKSTLARLIARELGFIYVDTGALYRAVGISVLRKKFNTASADDVVPTLSGLEIGIAYVDGEQRVYLNGEDVSDEIRRPEASMAASNVSAMPEVRAFLFDLQKDIAMKNDCVMDGRDIGTVVLPDADVKIFLSASPEERARRRYEEHLKKGVKLDYGELLEEIKQRDYNDSHREAAPMRAAEDAVLLDTTGLDTEQSLAKVMEVVKSGVI